MGQPKASLWYPFMCITIGAGLGASTGLLALVVGRVFDSPLATDLATSYGGALFVLPGAIAGFLVFIERTEPGRKA